MNSQTSSWANNISSVNQGSIFDPIFFLVYIIDLSDDYSSTLKFFTDATFLFSIVYHKHFTRKYLNDSLRKRSDWAYQRKMSFKLCLLKEAQESDFENILHITINHAVLLFKNKSKSVHYKSILEWFYIASYILKNTKI